MTTLGEANARLGTAFAGKYRLRRVLGVGGMGAVYEATHTFTNRNCAVKVLHPSHSSTPGYAARFLREARVAAEIGHPSICDVYDAGLDADGSLYLVLELLEGEDLGAAMKRGDLQVAEIVEIGVQVLEGLEAAHARGIVHRDVKPENVFLSRDESGSLRVKLLDFGVAKNVKTGGVMYNTLAGQIVGTPFYMSPEQATGDEVDGRADVWSCGAMLFHALAGRPPFDADNYNKLIVKILSETAPSLGALRKDLPPWLVEMVDGALKKGLDERWRSAAQMAAGLRSRGVAQAGLEWEGYEDATTRTDSPFGEAQDSLAPPADLEALATPRSFPRPAAAIAAPAGVPTVQVTMAATPSANAASATTPVLGAPPAAPWRFEAQQRFEAPQPFEARQPFEAPQAASTPQAWERARGRRGGGFLAGLLAGAALVLLIGIGVGTWLVLRGDAAPAPGATTGRPLASDAGTDAGADAGPRPAP